MKTLCTQSVTSLHVLYVCRAQAQSRAEYLADGELGIVGFSHGVVNESGHQFSDLVQIIGPGFLRDEETQ